jgi:hypothetical protein
MSDEFKYFCGMCLKNPVGYYTEYCGECMTPVKDPATGFWWPKHWYIWLEKDLAERPLIKKELVQSVDFGKFLEEFKERKSEWFVGEGKGAKESIVVRLATSGKDQPEPIKNKFYSKTVSLGVQTDADMNEAWNKTHDFQVRAAADDTWDALEPIND